MAETRTSIKPFVRAPGEGTPIWFTDGLLEVKLSGSESRGGLTIIEAKFPAGLVTPMHIHHAEDEAFYVLKGEIDFLAGGQTLKATAGSFVFGPKGVLHGFTVGEPGAMVLIITAPAGFEQFVVAAGEPARKREIPPAGLIDPERLMGAAAKYNIELLPDRQDRSG